MCIRDSHKSADCVCFQQLGISKIIERMIEYARYPYVSPFNEHVTSIGAMERYKLEKEFRWIYGRHSSKSIQNETYKERVQKIEKTYYGKPTKSIQENLFYIQNETNKEQNKPTKSIQDEPEDDILEQVKKIEKVYAEKPIIVINDEASTRAAYEIDRACADKEFEKKSSTIIMGTKKIHKYVDSNPNELCPCAIISNPFRCEIEFINLFKTDNGNIKIIDKIHLIGEFMLVFLKSEENFDELSSIITSCDKYEMCSEIDFMFPGFFDDKYGEIQTTICKIREENMNKYQKDLKNNAQSSIQRNNEELQRILAQKELEKMMRKLDITLTNTEHLYELLKIKSPKIGDIMKNYLNKTDQDVENLIFRITSFILKQYICDNKTIEYHPTIYVTSIILLLHNYMPRNDDVWPMFQSIAKKISNQLDLAQQNATIDIHHFLRLSENIPIKINANKDIYFDRNFKPVKFENLKQSLEKFIDDSSMLCFKEVILHNFIIIINSKINANGLFEYLPKDVLIIIIRNIIRMLNN